MDNDFDYVFSNFGIFFPQDDAAAIRETCRVLKPGGQAGFTTWKKISWWPEVAVPAMKAAFPEAPSLPDVKSLILKGYDDASIIEEKMKAGGFTDVNVHDYEFPPGVDADRFGEACGMLVALALGRLWSKEDVEKYGAPLKTIAALTKYLKGNFEGGTWNGKMTANIVLARKAN